MQPELVQTGAWGVCALAILKYQDVSNFWVNKEHFGRRKTSEPMPHLPCFAYPFHLFYEAFYHEDRWNKRIRE